MYLGFNFNIQGEIPREIENLVKLEAFVAQYMGLNGSIPSSIFNMSSLRVIVLYNNSLSGTISQLLGTGEIEFPVNMLWNYIVAAFSTTL
ncbi:hypothetical protein CCACVL1_21450 [Corchorus capsularis]|uniref:Uncharacterized protein n=1 Tax=Corchorus capsularis TaxID=210143 RepID=A0A1R3H5X0_COCAP|nr:hypothetical protein CCACVL1_21450 [Corchorus capsularis]